LQEIPGQLTAPINPEPVEMAGSTAAVALGQQGRLNRVAFHNLSSPLWNPVTYDATY